MTEKNELKYAFIGSISAGKTTVINGLLKSNIGDTHIRKTTILPHKYTETMSNYDKLEDIKENTIRETKIFCNNKKTPLLNELKYNIKPLEDFTVFENNIKLSIYDIPGLNDAETKNMYYDYLSNIFININIVIWVIDVNSALNTSDEIDICNFLLEKIKHNKINHTIDTKLIVLLNKCDNIRIDDGKLILDREIQDMYIQAKRMIDTSIAKIYPSFKYVMIPFSAEKTYIYRMTRDNDVSTLDEKYINILGQYEFSNREWQSMSYDTKISNLRYNLVNNDFNNELEKTGFNRFRNIFQSYFNDGSESLFLLDILKSTMIGNIDTKCSISNKIQLYTGYKNSIEDILNKTKLERTHVDNINKIINKCVYTVIKNYEEGVMQYINVDSIQYDNIDNYIHIKNTYDKLFNIIIGNDEHKTLSYTKLLGLITRCTINKIQDTTDINEQITYIANLKHYGYEKWDNILTSCIIENKTINTDTNLFIEIVKKCHNKLQLTPVFLITISIKMMDYTYSKFYVSKNISTVLSCAKYWDNYLIKSSNPYSFTIFKLKRLLNKYIDTYIDSSHTFNMNYQYTLENFIIGIITKVYVNDVLSKDDLFN
jgi:hypothetical protein